MTEKQEKMQTLKTIITETCNKVGCEECDLKWNDSCSAIDLQNKIDTLDQGE